MSPPLTGNRCKYALAFLVERNFAAFKPLEKDNLVGLKCLESSYDLLKRNHFMSLQAICIFEWAHFYSDGVIFSPDSFPTAFHFNIIGGKGYTRFYFYFYFIVLKKIEPHRTVKMLSFLRRKKGRKRNYGTKSLLKLMNTSKLSMRKGSWTVRRTRSTIEIGRRYEVIMLLEYKLFLCHCNVRSKVQYLLLTACHPAIPGQPREVPHQCRQALLESNFGADTTWVTQHWEEERKERAREEAVHHCCAGAKAGQAHRSLEDAPYIGETEA